MKTFDSATINAPFSFSVSDDLADGTAIDQADMAWWDTDRNLNATTENIDLAGSLTDAFGATATFVKVKGILVHNKNTTAGETLKIGGAASNAFLLFDNATDIYELGPDGVFVVWEPSAAALPVTASTGDILKMDAGSANITYDIVVVGTSA